MQEPRKITTARMNKIKTWAAEQKKSLEQDIAKLDRIIADKASQDEIEQADLLLRAEEQSRKSNSPRYQAEINRLLWALLESIGVRIETSGKGTKRIRATRSAQKQQ